MSQTDKKKGERHANILYKTTNKKLRIKIGIHETIRTNSQLTGLPRNTKAHKKSKRETKKKKEKQEKKRGR